MNDFDKAAYQALIFYVGAILVLILPLVIASFVF